MWNWAVNLIASGVTSAFGWLGSILDAAPGAWSSLLTIFVILAVSRYLLAPVLGFSFGVGSDTVKGHKNRAEFRRRTKESFREMKEG